jgi:putative glycosyltransferase (TIGR04372 family)
MVYGRPLLIVNALPLVHINSFADNEWVPKRLYHSDSGQELALDEYLKASFTRSEDFTNAGITVVDLTEEEIFISVREFWNRIPLTMPLNGVSREQRDFWLALERSADYGRLHGWIHPRARVATWWLDSVSA